jgi:hypothetical protein
MSHYADAIIQGLMLVFHSSHVNSLISAIGLIFKSLKK